MITGGINIGAQPSANTQPQPSQGMGMSMSINPVPGNPYRDYQDSLLTKEQRKGRDNWKKTLQFLNDSKSFSKLNKPINNQSIYSI